MSWKTQPKMLESWINPDVGEVLTEEVTGGDVPALELG